MILNDNSTQQINTLVIQLQNRITNLINESNKKVSEINDKISDLDTLKKEIADLTKNQVNVDSSMNKQITENKNNIAANTSAISALNTQIQTNNDNIATNTSDISALKTSVAGKADKSHTHTKSEITDIENTTTKTLDLNTVSTDTTKYIKLGTFHWYDNFSLKCGLYGDCFQDVVNINILNGNTDGASVCGYYSTNSQRTKAIIVKRGDSWSSDIEIYLQVTQITTLNIDVTIDKEYQDRINISESTTAPSGKLETLIFNNNNGMFSNNIDAKNLRGTADKTVGVVDYGNTSRTIRIGYEGPGVTADKLLYLAGYTESDGSSVKIKDVDDIELIKWLGIPRIRYADYQTPSQTFTQFQQVPIELSKFSSEVTPNNVLCFMVIYWSGVQLIASADWGNAASSGLKCALIALQAGTGYATIRCVYMV